MKIFKPLAHILISLALLASTAFASISNQTARVGPFIVGTPPANLSVTFPYQNSADLIVLNFGQGGVEHDPAIVLTLNSDYTVTGGGYNSSTQMQTGSVIVQSTGAHPVESGDYIMILRNTPVTQTTVFSSSGILTGPMIEKALDKGITVSQQLTEEASRALRFEPGETLDGTLIRSARAGKYLAFDSTGAIAYSDGGSGGGGTTYTAGAGLQLNSNEFSVLPTQSFTDLTITNPIVGSVTGNAATATKLATSRTINGVAFDGSGDIVVAAAAGTLTGTALPATITSAPGLLSTAGGTLGTMAFQPASAVNITGGTINGATVTGLPVPSASTDAATKDYVDNISAGIVPRTPVVAATTANITLSGPQTIDGQSVIAGNRVLVKNQTLTENNGIYDVAAGAWSRSSDSNTAAELLFGYYYFVSAGSTQGSTSWFIQTAPTVLGTDPVVFAQFSASQNYTAGAGLSLAGNVFSNTGVLSVTGTANQITASASTGAITLSTPSTLTFTGKTVTGGTFNGGAFNGTVGATTPNSGVFTNLSATNGSIVLSGGANPLVSLNDGTGFGYLQVVAGDINLFPRAGKAVTLGSNWATITSTGINAAAIGATTPSTGAFTTLSGSVTATGGSASRTLAAHFKDIINVKDFGATGDGVTNDTTAIAAAVTALTANSTLYFPAGVYLTDVIGFASKTFVAIKGDGRTATTIRNRVAGNVIYFRPTCSDITMQDLTIDNNNSSRTAGQHGIVIGCSRFNLSNVGVTRCGEYAVLTGWDQIAGTTTAVSDIIVSNLYVYNTYADGMHFMTTTRGTLTNSIFVTDDDCIAVDGSFHVTVSNCVGTARNDLGTTWGRGIAVFNGSTDVIVSGCEMSNIKQAGIRVELAGGSAPARVTFADCLVYNCGLSSDGNIDVESGTDVSFIGGASRNAFNGNHMILQSGTRLTVNGMEFGSTTNAYARGITTGDTTSTEAIAGLFLVNNTFSFPLASQNEGIRIAKGISGAYYSNVAVTGNTGTDNSSVYMISTRNMASTSKVYNNTSIGAAACYFHDTGGGGSTPANANNN